MRGVRLLIAWVFLLMSLTQGLAFIGSVIEGRNILQSAWGHWQERDPDKWLRQFHWSLVYYPLSSILFGAIGVGLHRANRRPRRLGGAGVGAGNG